MIEHLRKKLILTHMALVSLVIVAALAVQVLSACRQAAEEVYQTQLQTLDFLKSGRDAEFRLSHVGRTRAGAQSPEPPDETSLQRRGNFVRLPSFAVEIDENGKILSLHCGPGVEVSGDAAQAMADYALAASSQKGELAKEKFSYIYRFENNRRYLSFADNTMVRETIKRQVLISLAILGGTLTAFYWVSRYLADWSLRPVEKAWEQQRQFVADASHELKTPITVILANIDLVLAHPDRTVHDESKWINYTREEANRMKALVSDLLFLAKSDAARQPAVLTPVSLSDLVTGSLISFESMAFESGITLDDLIDPGVTVLGNEAQLRRLTVILLDNAVKYAGEGGTVSVTLDAPGEQPRLTVHNTGPAIPEEQQARLFERFYRADAARDRDRGGVGLGLSIAKSIVDAHGGQISVSSAPGEGVTFTVTFPKNGKAMKR